MADLEQLPESVRPLVQFLLREDVLIALGAVSLVTFVLGVIGIPLFFARLPADYYTRREQKKLGLSPRPMRVAVRIAKNLLGLVLFVLGLAMLLLPGQGVLTLLVSLTLLDFPGKRRLERRILSTASVSGFVNALRRRAGREPLILTPEGAPARADGGSDPRSESSN